MPACARPIPGLRRRNRLAAGVAAVLLLAACGTAPRKEAPPVPAKPGVAKPGYYLDDGPGDAPPANLAAIPDATPRDEPPHRGANKPYTVFGRTYVPVVTNEPFRQTGMASWYGRKFHGQKTSIGETYDMYAMTAAHPTLPLPCYVRVTSAATGKAVVVRVNDRGPFLHDRVIDLSFAAAHRLGIAGPGSGRVTVERIFAGNTQVAQVATSSGGASAGPAATSAGSDPITAAIGGPPLAGGVAPATATIPALPQPVPAQITTPPTPISTDAGGVFIQLGAFGSAENAEGFKERMTRDLAWMREPLSVAFRDGLHRVRIGPLANREEAEAIAAKVRETHDLTTHITKP